MKKLGFGLMRLPLLDENDGGSIDLERSKEMVDAFIAKGFTYFDTAYMYCNGQSERAAKEVLVTRHPRDSFTLATKLPPHMVKSMEARDEVFADQLNKTGAGYFDYYLLHCINDETICVFEEYDCFTWLQEKKKNGLVKNVGFSFHGGPALLDRVLTEHTGLDFVQLQINYLDWESEGVQSRACYEIATRHGVPVIVMEPVKGGALANVPKSVEDMFRAREATRSPSSWAIRFAASLPNVMMVLSGMSNMEQVLDNTAYMADFESLTAEETQMLHMAADIIKGQITIPCTGCAYCTENCPQGIAIPQYFALYNEDLRINHEQAGEEAIARYKTLTEAFSAASACIGCGDCESRCPQRIAIRELLKDIATRYE
jgi:predicted aldo/keto reductase-like oxidoreductase